MIELAIYLLSIFFSGCVFGFTLCVMFYRRRDEAAAVRREHYNEILGRASNRLNAAAREAGKQHLAKVPAIVEHCPPTPPLIEVTRWQ